MSELSKWANAQPTLGVLRDFFGWCEEQKMELAVPTPSGNRLMPIGEAYEALFARYLDIDTVKLENERRALLEKHLSGQRPTVGARSQRG